MKKVILGLLMFGMFANSLLAVCSYGKDPIQRGFGADMVYDNFVKIMETKIKQGYVPVRGIVETSSAQTKKEKNNIKP